MYIDEMNKPQIFENAGRQNYKDLEGWMNRGLGPAAVCTDLSNEDDVLALGLQNMDIVE